ncbi:MAG: hypothetical protein J0M19_13100 [Sphingomonadales bacterium]|nr:hypothetical protein [Sphingomonadales bacterium]
MTLLPRHLIAVALLGLSLPASAQDIVVKGKPLSETAADLEACLKRKCPPGEDIKASLAHAENLFVAGKYDDAQRTLHASLGRNRKHGKAYPGEVSDLLRANGRVAEHMGEGREYQLSTLDMRDTLRSGFGKDDFRTLVADVEVGDSRAKLGFPDEAERIYRDVEKRALAANQYRVASFARLRLATLARTRFDAEPTGANRKELDKRLGLLIDSPLPGGNEFVLAAKVLRARIDRKAGSATSTDALVKEFAAGGGATRPILLYSEPVARINLEERSQADGDTSRPAWTRMSTNRYGQWVDVGFWIGQNGKVSDVEVLRSSGDVAWAKPVLATITRRIYAPLKTDGDSAPGFYMIERYTLTARVSDGETGTHLRTREAQPRIERLDLTEENYEVPKSGG